MASDAEIQKKNYQKYMEMPNHSPEVANEMWRQLQYANTIDRDVAKKANELLNQ